MISPPVSPQSIVWLASYPKSGNTWLRAMLTHLVQPVDQPLDLSNLYGGPLADNRHTLDDHCGISSAEFRYDELLSYRPMLHYQLAIENRRPHFIKTHDMHVHDDNGRPLFPPAASAAVVYLVRNPLDVAVSFAHHAVADIDLIIDRMADESAMLNQWPDRISSFLPVRMGSWSGHVESWTRQAEIPILILRYEDILANTLDALEQVVATAGLDCTRAQCADAVEATRFDRLRALEWADGFVEKPVNSPYFFRTGTRGGGREFLASRQIDRLVADHRVTMARFDYESDLTGDD